MKYGTKSVIIGRKPKDEECKEGERPCFVSLFDINDPHKTAEVPKEILEFRVHKVIISDLDVNYLLPGNDLVINNLKSVDVEKEGDHLHVTGEQTEKED